MLDPENNQVSITLLLYSFINQITPPNNSYLSIQGTKFTVKATITGFTTDQEWYYNSCPRCYRQLKQTNHGWWCDSHGHLKTTPSPW